MQEQLISKATQNNWKRLNLDNETIKTKLTSGANKCLSMKKIIPVEYIKNPDNMSTLTKILSYQGIKSIIYTISLKLLHDANLIKLNKKNIASHNPYLLEILNNFNTNKIIDEIFTLELPKDERDLLGIIYQMHLSEGTKSKTGSYYTPVQILESIFANVKPEAKFLDPCCGTGSFLLAASDTIKNPDNIYGCDIDEIACFIAKINLILKFKDIKFRPNIYNIDFLTNYRNLPEFDVIATNPPWGAVTKPALKSKESFSCFIINSQNLLKPKGKMFFVLPESIMNVKTHKDIRRFILNNFHIDKIEQHGRVFSSVLSKVITLHLNKDKTASGDIIITDSQRQLQINQKFYETNINNNFSILDNKDIKILEKIYSIPHQKLDNTSIWAIGIVTGNNKNTILKKSKTGEKIYSGKNILKNKINETDNYIVYDRTKFQQTAPTEVYRAKEKLVYKFISKKLVFAYDNKQRLFLNSANILIPKLKGYDIKTVMAFLNSALFGYIYTKKFNELKVLKGNLMELPFPCINSGQKITQDTIFELFNLTDDEISYIKNEAG